MQCQLRNGNDLRDDNTQILANVDFIGCQGKATSDVKGATASLPTNLFCKLRDLLPRVLTILYGQGICGDKIHIMFECMVEKLGRVADSVPS